ncbi:hypothetical protein GCM10023086_38950 [Streptomyces venetus]|uniref:Uncharacterized protein n=1 Tax=Streptomyces venetus TaxID=1701086 RepID=A0ABP8G395_9ACTN
MSRWLPVELSADVVSLAIAAIPYIGVVPVALLLVVTGIFYPAVWSRDRERRRDARLLAFRILRWLERRRR